LLHLNRAYLMYEGVLGVGFRVKLSDEDIADFDVLKDVVKATIFGF